MDRILSVKAVRRGAVALAASAAALVGSLTLHGGSVHAAAFDLSITKTDGSATAVRGVPITYTITVTNLGPDDASGATVIDAPNPANFTGVTWTCTATFGSSCTSNGSGSIDELALNLLAGGSATYILTATVAPAATAPLINTAGVSAVDDTNPSNNNATDTDTLEQADLSIIKTDGATTATPGGTVTYTIIVANAGPSTVTGATVTDLFPLELSGITRTCVSTGGATGCSSGTGNIVDSLNLPVAATVTYTVSATISAAATGTLSNTATVATPATVTDLNLANNTAADSDTLTPQADLAIIKNDGGTTAVPGGTVTYMITASNTTGPSNVTGATVADPVPVGVTAVAWSCVGTGGGTCSLNGSGVIGDTVNLPVGGTVTYTAIATIDPAASGSLINTATVTAPGGVTESNPGNNSASDSDTLTPQADLAITKTDGVVTAAPGGSVTYTITVTNAGLSDSTGVSVEDDFPNSLTVTWTCAGLLGGTCTANGSGDIDEVVNLPSGGSVTFTASATISAAATGTLTNTATVSGGSATDGTPGNNSATDVDTLAAQADLMITKTDGVTSVVPGSSVTYTITASNLGPSNATGATVADTFPAAVTGITWTCVGAGGGTCTASGSGNLSGTVNLPAGASVTYAATGTLSDFATGSLSNTATVAAPGGVTDATPANNSATDTDAIVATAANLSVTKTGPAGAAPGTNVTYTLTASNTGPNGAVNAVLSDTLPAGVTFVSLAQNTGPAATMTTPAVGGTGSVAITWATLASGTSATFTLVVAIGPTFQGSLLNTATISSDTNDSDATNNSGAATVAVTTTTTTTTTTTIAPTTTTIAPTTTTTPVAGLPPTGGNSAPLGMAALVILLAGAALATLAARRSRSTTTG